MKRDPIVLRHLARAVVGLTLFAAAWLPAQVFAQALRPSAPSAEAAKAAAENDPACRKLAPFYWEIGTKNSVLVSGATGDGSIGRTSSIPIASASKWLFGAYAIEKLQGVIDPVSAKFLHMSAGYTSLRPLACIGRPTVQACFEEGDNARYTAANDNHFYYGGGHFQKWGVDHGLGPLDRPGLVAEYQKYLGADIPMQFGLLQFAGGLNMSAAGYATFLQKILDGRLKIGAHLGEDAVCTLPASCPGQALSSPVPVAWHYSYGHWVEDAPNNGDGAFSSAGAFGFYPWIDASKTYYGIISRRQMSRGPDGGAGVESAFCGQKIRHGFLTGS